ncbi:MAG: transcription elongation factor Spt5 [Candidatus Micrarchaeia archaeon]
MLFSYRVTTGQEHIVMEMLVNKIKKNPEGTSAVFIFPDVKGYMFIETIDISHARKLAQGIPSIKGVLAKEVPLDEIVKLGEARVQVIPVAKGDIVEFTSGPFKGERAKVIKVDETKDTITVELTDVAVPVPVTTKSGTVKLIQKAED